MKYKKLALLMLMMLGIAACAKKVPPQVIPAPPSTPPPAPVKAPVAVPEEWPELPLPPSWVPPELPAEEPASFLEGEESFEKQEYPEAARAYEKFLGNQAFTKNRDRAMFRLGIAYALTCENPPVCGKALAQFRSLVSLFTDSPYKPQAELILTLQNDIDRLRADSRSKEDRIKKLTGELEKLKKIDLERRPSRPPE